jgi:hypothetical protein
VLVSRVLAAYDENPSIAENQMTTAKQVRRLGGMIERLDNVVLRRVPIVRLLHASEYNSARTRVLEEQDVPRLRKDRMR